MKKERGIIAVIVIASLGTVGCQSKATSARFDAAQQYAFACQTQAMQVKQARASQPKTTYADPRDQLLVDIVGKVLQAGTASDMDACDDAYVAMVKADGMKTGKLIDGGFKLGGIGLGLVGVNILTNGITELAGSGSDSYSFRDVNMTNTAGVGGMAEGGAATMSFNAGGDTNLLGPNASQIQSEKFQDNGQNEGNPVQDDSDGNNNNPGIFN